MTRDWRYRWIDDDGVVHIEHARKPGHTSPGYMTTCNISVGFGSLWDDDWRMVVTCVRCLGAR
jgi:hypothetical protein